MKRLLPLLCLPLLSWINLSASAATYTFIDGYNVLDEANSPGIGTNLAATAGIERGFGVDVTNGIIYFAGGKPSTQDGRANRPVGAIAAIVTTNGFDGSNFTDTGLVFGDADTPPISLSQSPIVVDYAKNRLLVLWQGPFDVGLGLLYSAPIGTLGGAPDGGDPSAVNPVLTNILTIPQYYTGGTPLAMAARTSNGVTTVYVGLGFRVEAWSDDATNGAPQYPWQRIWATLPAPVQDSVSIPLSQGDTRLNGIEVDDEGNCYFTVEFTSPPRIWCVPANAAAAASDPSSLDFDDRAVGGNNSGPNALIVPVIPRLPSPAVTLGGTNTFVSPQSLAFFRTDGRKGLFVSSDLKGPTFITSLRSIVRMVLDDPSLDANGYPCVGAAVVDAFGSSAAASCQDAILQTLQPKSSDPANGLTQPMGFPGNNTTDLLCTKVNSITNPTVIYFDAFVTDTNKGQTIPTAALGMASIPPLPPSPSITGLTPTNGPTAGGTLVTITGSNFVSDLMLSFGASNAVPVNFSNANLVTVLTPAHPSATVDVVMQNPNGLLAVVTNGFQYGTAVAPFWITSAKLLDNNSLKIVWDAVPNMVYQPQSLDDLGAANWATLGSVTAATTSASFTNTGISTAARQFYRVICNP